MSRLILGVTLLCVTVSAFAQDIDKLPVITVSGTAEVWIEPDEVVFSIDVTKSHRDLQTAKRLNDESIGRILELMRRFSVVPQNVQTSYVSVDMKYDSIRDAKTKVFNDDGQEVGRRVFRAYEVSKTVTVRLVEMQRFEELFAEVLKTGISELGRVRFETSKLRENKDKAREMAMRAAKEKAAAMASALGQTIGKAIRITEGNAAIPMLAGNIANARSLAGSEGSSDSLVTFAPGAIKVEAHVTVSFQLN